MRTSRKVMCPWRQALEKELESVASKMDLGDMATVVVRDLKRDGETSTIFLTYDRNQSGALEFEELQECLSDLGALVAPPACARNKPSACFGTAHLACDVEISMVLVKFSMAQSTD